MITRMYNFSSRYVASSGEWILETGFWNNNGVWRNDVIWTF